MKNKKNTWTPKKGQKYWYIDVNGTVDCYYWYGEKFNNDMKNFIGVFKTKKEAQARLEEIKKKLKL